MPKYLKDTKIEIWKERDGWQDDVGAHHHGERYKAGTVWANLKGVDYSEFYALHAKWPAETLKATVTRPSWDVDVGDRVRHKGKFYRVETINDLTGRIGRDMVLTCQIDPRYTVTEG